MLFVNVSISDYQFDITEENINEIKKEIVKTAAYKAAKNATESYKYKLISPEDVNDIRVEEV